MLRILELVIHSFNWSKFRLVLFYLEHIAFILAQVFSKILVVYSFGAYF